MNAYAVEFFAKCPTNGVRIHYRLTIERSVPVTVERLIEEVEQIEHGFHEDIADHLFAIFGGAQTMIADHHSVTITTTRSTE